LKSWLFALRKAPSPDQGGKASALYHFTPKLIDHLWLLVKCSCREFYIFDYNPGQMWLRLPAFAITNQWMWEYNNIRPHDSLMNLPPTKFLLKYGKIKDFPTFQQDIDIKRKHLNLTAAN
jgi:transposase InsO family protein